MSAPDIKYNLPWAIFLFLVALAIRFWGYCSAPLGLDEPFTVFHSQQSLSELFSLFMNENNPPLFFMLMHFWIGLFGIDPEWLRVVPVVISALITPALYLMAKRHFGSSIAIVVSFLFLFSNLQQFHAHEIRAYSLFVLLTVWSLHHFLSILEQPKPTHIFCLGLSGILLLYNHFLGVIVLLSYALVTVTVSEFRNRIFKHMFITGLMVIAGFLPYATIMLNRIGETAENGTWVPKPGYTALYDLLWSFCNQPVLAVASIILLVIGLLSVVIKKQSVSSKEKAILLLFLFPYFGMFVASQWFPMYLNRYMIFVSVPFYLTIACLTFRITHHKISIWLVTVLAVGFLLTFKPHQGHMTNELVLAERIKLVKQKDEALIIHPEWTKLGFSYHYDRDIFRDYRNVNDRLEQVNAFPVFSVDDLPETFGQTFERAYLITPTTNGYDWIAKFKNDLTEIFPNVETDTIIGQNSILVYSK